MRTSTDAPRPVAASADNVWRREGMLGLRVALVGRLSERDLARAAGSCVVNSMPDREPLADP
jgi:hypothetical protein